MSNASVSLQWEQKVQVALSELHAVKLYTWLLNPFYLELCFLSV